MGSRPEGPRSGSPRLVDLNRLANAPGYKLAINTPDDPDELQSHLRVAEADAESKRRSQEAEDAHTRRKDLIVHVFVMAVAGIAFVVCVWIVLNPDPRSSLPDKAMAPITVIVSAGVGYMTGKGSN